MSIAVVKALFDSDHGYQGGSLVVLLCLAEYANHVGLCWPAIGQIARRTRLTERQVFSILRQLTSDEDPIISIQRGGGRGRKNSYQFNLERLKLTSVNAPANTEVPCASASETLKPSSVFPAENPAVDFSVSPNKTLKHISQNPEVCSGAIRKNHHEPPNAHSAFGGRKSNSASAARTADPRHHPTEELIKRRYREKFGITCPWDGSEGAALKRLLASNPNWTEQDLARMVANRFLSECVNGDRPRLWLSNLAKWAAGPLDQFKNPKSNGNGHHRFPPTPIPIQNEPLSENDQLRLAEARQGEPLI